MKDTDIINFDTINFKQLQEFLTKYLKETTFPEEREVYTIITHLTQLLIDKGSLRRYFITCYQGSERSKFYLAKVIKTNLNNVHDELILLTLDFLKQGHLIGDCLFACIRNNNNGKKEKSQSQ